MRIGIIVLVGLLAGSVQAGELSIGVVYSAHTFEMDDGGDLENTHLMLSYTHDESQLTVAAIINHSYGGNAVTAGRRWELGRYGPVLFDGYLGAVVGYGDKLNPNYAGVAPFGWLGVEIDTPVDGMTFNFRAAHEVMTVGVNHYF